MRVSPPPNAKLAAAVEAIRAGAAEEAEPLAAAALVADPKSALAAHLLGTARLMQGRAAAAVAPLQRAVALSNDPANETLLARALAASGKPEPALVELRKATARRPAYLLAFRELGDLLAALGRLDEAAAAFEAGLAIAPDADGLRVGLGYAHLQRSDLGAARAAFEAVHRVAPQRQDAVVGLAKVTALAGDFAAAAALYRRALALRPDDAAARLGLANCLLELGDRPAGEAAVREGAGTSVGLAARALAQTSHGRFFLRPSRAAEFLAG